MGIYYFAPINVYRYNAENINSINNYDIMEVKSRDCIKIEDLEIIFSNTVRKKSIYFAVKIINTGESEYSIKTGSVTITDEYNNRYTIKKYKRFSKSVKDRLNKNKNEYYVGYKTDEVILKPKDTIRYYNYIWL